MEKKKIFAKEEISKVLGEDFWDSISDVLPFAGLRVDMYRGETEIMIVAEIPGLSSPNDISITLKGYYLILEGKITREYAINKESFLLDERLNGPFKRKIRLPKDCLLDGLQADYWNGLLFIRVPFSEENDEGQTNRIPINFHS